jgi:predicted TIM-barrel fold metal-dependent hydrolase
MRLFDAHFHIIDSRFPLVPNDGFLPEEFDCYSYLRRMQGHDLAGGAVVSGSFQAVDQTYLIAALQRLGPGFVGVTQLPETVSDGELIRLDGLGVRALRFNLRRGGPQAVRHLDSMARRAHEVVGWHVELYADSTELAEIYATLRALPSVSIDHLGLSRAGFGTVRRLVEQGARVKATGFGRGDLDIRSCLRDLYSAHPGALVFGTDLPSTRARRPYRDRDYALVIETLGEAAAGRVFYDNAASLYRLTVQS